MGKNDVPDGWEKYSRYGSRIPNTPFVAFKVPLSENLQGRYNREYLPRATTDQALEHRWTLDTLGKTFPDLGLVIDLTATDRYYNPRSMKARHVKIKTQGHVVPDQNVIKLFFDEVDKALDLDEDTLIGVHCTHGINRTGYLICRYLIEKLNWDPEKAIREFGRCRGHAIERANYLQSLKSLKPNLRVTNELGNLTI